jgi:hypothetical protein
LAPFAWERSGRNPRALLVVAAVWVGLAGLWLAFDAAPWVLAFPALATLPALWEYLADTRAGLVLGPDAIRWHSGRRGREVVFGRIEKVRFDTRLDMSVRVTLILRNGTRLRIPSHCLPPHRLLEAEMQARGIVTERHHFSFS